ncbi:MAG TPA: tRNA lysidine(34) synthetase TilS, partial [Candidatus Omnitrophica bacterium]|nr:tRNA lysidine(34) synthetase TilS [Candidatus Omnitrophota bacterium]
ARRERYLFLTTTAKNNRCNKIAVAHNRDDQAETFLHRLIRGSGLRGFQGMAYKSSRGGVSIIRPLLCCFRKEIEDYINICGITACQDHSNYDTKFTRNKIRHELVSYLEQNFNPNIKEVLFNTSCTMQELYGFIESQAYAAFKRCVKKEGDCVNINQDRLKKLHPYIITEVIRMAFELVKGDLKRFEYAHYKEIESLIYKRPVGSVVDLPAGIKVVKNKHWLTIGR